MKEVKVTIRYKVSDEFYENDMKDVKNDIESGKMQRDSMKHAKEGLKSVKATFEVKDL